MCTCVCLEGYGCACNPCSYVCVSECVCVCVCVCVCLRFMCMFTLIWSPHTDKNTHTVCFCISDKQMSTALLVSSSKKTGQAGVVFTGNFIYIMLGHWCWFLHKMSCLLTVLAWATWMQRRRGPQWDTPGQTVPHGTLFKMGKGVAGRKKEGKRERKRESEKHCPIIYGWCRNYR